MTNINGTGDHVTKWIRRVARIWSSPLIVYSLIMLAGYTWNWVTTGKADPYAVEGYPITEALPPILMLLSVLGLIFAWRWERLWGTITLVFLFATLMLLLIQRPITQDFNRSMIPYLMSAAIAVPGILFLVCWRRSRGVQLL